MTIHAIALLRVSRESLPEAARARAKALEDGLLLTTDASFADDPEELSVAVRAVVGPALETEHRDPRGIFLIPDVVTPTGSTYEAVVDEIGEGGVWGPLVDSLDLPEGPQAFQAMLGNLLNQLPSSLIAAANAAAQGQPGAFEAMGAQLQGIIGRSGPLSELLSAQPSSAVVPPELLAMAASVLPTAADASGDEDEIEFAVGQHATERSDDPVAIAEYETQSAISDMAELAALLGGAGFQIDSPTLQQLARNVHAELERDPTAAAELAERLMSQYADQDGSDGQSDK
jgi:hypothetical protein